MDGQFCLFKRWPSGEMVTWIIDSSNSLSLTPPTSTRRGTGSLMTRVSRHNGLSRAAAALSSSRRSQNPGSAREYMTSSTWFLMKAKGFQLRSNSTIPHRLSMNFAAMWTIGEVCRIQTTGRSRPKPPVCFSIGGITSSATFARSLVRSKLRLPSYLFPQRQ